MPKKLVYIPIYTCIYIYIYIYIMHIYNAIFCHIYYVRGCTNVRVHVRKLGGRTALIFSKVTHRRHRGNRYLMMLIDIMEILYGHLENTIQKIIKSFASHLPPVVSKLGKSSKRFHSGGATQTEVAYFLGLDSALKQKCSGVCRIVRSALHTYIHFSPYVDCTGRRAQRRSTWRVFYSVLMALRAISTLSHNHSLSRRRQEQCLIRQ